MGDLMGDWFVEIRAPGGALVKSLGPYSETRASLIALAMGPQEEGITIRVIPPPCPHCGKPGDTEGSCGVGGCPLGLDT